MDPILETGAAAVAAGYIVAFAKLSAPRAPSWLFVAVAVCGGVLSALLVAVAGGVELTAQAGASVTLQGIGAAAIAAGLTRTDQAGEGRREEVG